MARPRKRLCLEDGLRLDLNKMIRDGTVISGAVTSETIFWIAGFSEPVGVAVITADLTDFACPRIRIRMRGLDQTIGLIAQPRSFGGSQLYFRCPSLGLAASVLWKPPGATRFCSRQSWGQVAYQTQFLGQARRARVGRERTASRLGRDNDAENGLLPPPKPKWMRWPSYDRRIERYKAYDAVLLEGIAKLSAQLGAN